MMPQRMLKEEAITNNISSHFKKTSKESDGHDCTSNRRMVLALAQVYPLFTKTITVPRFSQKICINPVCYNRTIVSNVYHNTTIPVRTENRQFRQGSDRKKYGFEVKYEPV